MDIVDQQGNCHLKGVVLHYPPRGGVDIKFMGKSIKWESVCGREEIGKGKEGLGEQYPPSFHPFKIKLRTRGRGK